MKFITSALFLATAQASKLAAKSKQYGDYGSMIGDLDAMMQGLGSTHGLDMGEWDTALDAYNNDPNAQAMDWGNTATGSGYECSDDYYYDADYAMTSDWYSGDDQDFGMGSMTDYNMGSGMDYGMGSGMDYGMWSGDDYGMDSGMDYGMDSGMNYSSLYGAELTCETQNFDQIGCEMISCCQWDDGQCWSAVGQDECYPETAYDYMNEYDYGINDGTDYSMDYFMDDDYMNEYVDETTWNTNATCESDMSVFDQDGDDCNGYASNPGWCFNYDDEDFVSADACCACGGGLTPEPSCISIDEDYVDYLGDSCADYAMNPDWCGGDYDDENFTDAQCCACQ